MLIHTPWTVVQTIKHLPGLVVFAVGLLTLALYAGLMALKDQFVPRETQSESERFADRALYSRRHRLDPLA